MNNLLGDRIFLREVSVICNRLDCGLPVTEEDRALVRKWIKAVKEENELSPMTIASIILGVIGVFIWLARMG